MQAQHKISVDELVGSVRMPVKILGAKDRCVSFVSRIDVASSECVAFCNKRAAEGLQMVRDSRAGVIISPDDLEFTSDDFDDRTLILVSRPRLAFIRIMQAHFLERPNPGISSLGMVDENAKIDPSVHIGPNSYIGDCQIGEGTVIHGSVHIYRGTMIGRNVLIQAGAVIGAEGQGFERNQKGECEKFPQIGGVVIEDDVEIGSNASIMRGAMGNTIIGTGTKIGHLCNVGHGAVIGKSCLILSMSMIGGSARIGDYSQISLGACVRNKIKIGKHVTVGMGAVVTKDIDDGRTVFGVPAREPRL